MSSGALCVVAYLFCYDPVVSDAGDSPALQAEFARQSLAIHSFSAGIGTSVVYTFRASASNPALSFTQTGSYRSALALAEREGGLFVATFSHLFQLTPIELLTPTIADLDAAPVDMIDPTVIRFWRRMTTFEKYILARCND